MVIYKMKSIGAAWNTHVSQTMYDLVYKSCELDLYVRMKEKSKTDEFE